jgi:hypothetical protein
MFSAHAAARCSGVTFLRARAASKFDWSVETSRRRAAQGKPAQQAERGLSTRQDKAGLASQYAGIVEGARGCFPPPGRRWRARRGGD